MQPRALVYAILCLNAIQASASDAPRAQREAAVIQARNGDAKAGLAALQELLQQYPEDPRLLADTVIVANWAGNDPLVLDLYVRAQTPKDDAGVVEAAARSARNLHRYDQSLELYRLAQTLDAARWQPHLGEAMVLTDIGDYLTATGLMQPLLRFHKNEKDVLLGEAYVCSRQNDFICVIDMYTDYLAQVPDNKQVRSNLTFALSRTGSQSYGSALYATEIASAVPDSLNGAAGGEEVIWGEAYAPTRAQQRAETETGLAILDKVIAASASKEATWRFAQYDRIIALFDLRQMQDVVQSYENLASQGVEVPVYALKSVAGAYLALHEPERAEVFYRKLVTAAPADGAAWSGLAYAQMERGNLNQSLATIDHAYKAASPWLQSPGSSAPMDNRMRLDLQSQAAQMRGEVDMLAEEQKRLQYLVAAAPANENLHWELAAAYLARGRTNRALDESRIADGYALPDEVPSLADAEIHEQAGKRDNVDAMLPALNLRDFDNPVLKRFLSNLRIERGWQLDAEAVFGWGSGVEVGDSDEHSELHLSTPLYNNRWRIYGHELRDSGDFGTSSAARTRGGIGARYDYNRQTAWAELARDAGTNRTAGNAGTELSFNDFWTLRAVVDSDSFDVPVRALLGNVHGRSLDADLSWRSNESHSANAGLQRVLFSDGNQRAALSGAWEERVMTTPRLQANIALDASASRNSLDENRYYFNPKSDLSLGPRASLDWLTWRRYDRGLHQELEIYAGPYRQENYATKTAASIRYAQRWKLRPGLEGRGGVTWNSQPYDGSNEHYTAIDFSITWGRL